MSTPQATPLSPRSKITFVIGTKNRPHLLAGVLSSLQAQTDPNWDALVMVESEATNRYNGDEYERAIAVVHRACLQRPDEAIDTRINIVPGPMPWRKDWHQTIKRIGATAAAGEFIAFPNDDVYYVPTFVAAMTTAAHNHGLDLVYCDWLNPEMGYLPHCGMPQVGHIDVGGFIVSRRAWHRYGLKEGLWQCGRQTADGEFVQALANVVAHGKAPGVLYIKN